MPEPEPSVLVPCCGTLLSWTVGVRDGGRTFSVSLVSRGPDGVTASSYSCDCPDFRPGSPCHHALYAAGFHCAWYRGRGQEEMVDPGSCPRCGGPVGTAHIQ